MPKKAPIPHWHSQWHTLKNQSVDKSTQSQRRTVNREGTILN
jgi:hypothetical protein